MGKKIETLNDLLQGENMAVDAFNIYIDRVEDENIKKAFQEVQNQHRENMSVLANHIQDLGYEPKEKLGFKGVMADFMINMNLALGKDSSDILNKAIEGEMKGIKMAEEVSRGNLDEESREIVSQVLQDDRSSLAKLQRLNKHH